MSNWIGQTRSDNGGRQRSSASGTCCSFHVPFELPFSATKIEADLLGLNRLYIPAVALVMFLRGLY